MGFLDWLVLGVFFLLYAERTNQMTFQGLFQKYILKVSVLKIPQKDPKWRSGAD